MGETDVLNGGLRLQDQPQSLLEIVISTNAGTLEGRVLNEQQQPVGPIWVAAIPENGQRFRVDHKYTSTDASGRFQLQGMPPGDYKVFAWEDAEKGVWQDQGFVRNFESRGAPVHIDEGSKTTVEVTSIPARN
jgi:hypothetical protein